eukprot:767438-Hanusia_phi.AAC.10
MHPTEEYPTFSLTCTPSPQAPSYEHPQILPPHHENKSPKDPYHVDRPLTPSLPASIWRQQWQEKGAQGGCGGTCREAGEIKRDHLQVRTLLPYPFGFLAPA